jgi:hypothetical protein
MLGRTVIAARGLLGVRIGGALPQERAISAKLAPTAMSAG